MTFNFELLTYTGITSCVGFIFLLFNKRIHSSSKFTQQSDDMLTQEMNQLEKRISERTQELLHVEKERYQELERVAQFGALSQGLFHDLMSPLTSISLYLERIKTTHDTNEVQDMLQKTVQASRRMNSFMHNIRKSIEIPEHHATTSANVYDELSVVRDMLIYKARTTGTTIRIPDQSTDHPIHISIHPVRIQQLFINLISNAIDACEQIQIEHTKENEQSVTVSLLEHTEGITIKIIDTGCGISPEHVDHIWTHSFTTKPKGTGMGLATVKTIVEHELHGSITVQSRKKQGTTFTIHIPTSQLA